MNRRNPSIIKEIIEITGSMPWWVGVVLAVVFFSIFHYFAMIQIIPSSNPTEIPSLFAKLAFKTFSQFLQIIVPIAFLAMSLISEIKKRRRDNIISGVIREESSDVLNDMTWQEFESLVGEAFRLRGFTVAETGGGGADGGVDLVLKKGKETTLVQCKQWRAYKVGVKTVRELYGVMAARGATGGYVVTSGQFTDDAKDFASGRNIELIDGKKLHIIITKGSTL